MARMSNGRFHNLSVPALIRKLVLTWLFAVTVESFLLPSQLSSLQVLDGLAQMSFGRMVLITCIGTFGLIFCHSEPIERWSIAGVYLLLSIRNLIFSFTWPFLAICTLVFIVLVYYAVKGWNHTAIQPSAMATDKKVWHWCTALIALAFFVFVSLWTVSRIYSYCTPTFDFGIFSQMFYSMKTTGLPLTTVERDGLLSHFHVHVSPIYYLLLPVYYLFPYPATLQISQAAILASAVIPLWLICKNNGLHPMARMAVCALLLLYPAYSGGASYDIHENAFLAPLILWLFYVLDCKKYWLSGIFAFLVLCVKEDAAVYVAVIALYYSIRSLLYQDWRQLIFSIGIAVVSVIWFLWVTSFLANVGDGVMTYRYSNFIYDGSGSLLSVIKAVLLCPMKAVFECVDSEKLRFIAFTVLPLVALPFFTRRYERYILLIPYILINLMSDYQYQHNIFFQYTYGSTACLFYLLVVNLSDLKIDFHRIIALGTALMICAACFLLQILPKSTIYIQRWQQNRDYYRQVTDMLSCVPDEASVSATTFYTTYLSQRPVLYDIQYASMEHILSTEYIVLDINYTSPYKKYATSEDNGLEVLIAHLEEQGYTLFLEWENNMVIYQKAQ